MNIVVYFLTYVCVHVCFTVGLMVFPLAEGSFIFSKGWPQLWRRDLSSNWEIKQLSEAPNYRAQESLAKGKKPFQLLSPYAICIS